MIIKKFEEQVERFSSQPAVKKAGKTFTYGQLNQYANAIAHAIAAVGDNGEMTGRDEINSRQTALLFEHGMDMIVAIIGTLKADRAYVPLDINYPQKRILYILENSRTSLILTNTQNLSLAQELSAQAKDKIAVLNIETIGKEAPETTIKRDLSPDKIAYILYTSGSTGTPKGVYQTHGNVLYYTRNWIEKFAITSAERMSLFTSFTHDGAVQDIFSALLSGACLYPYSMKENGQIDELYLLLLKEKITIWHSVPSLYRFFANDLNEKDLFYDLRWILLGGEPLREHDLKLFKTFFPHAQMANIYGQTESSVSTICCINRQHTFDDAMLGDPLDETQIFLVREDGNIVENMGIGEIAVVSNYLAPGYWQDPNNTEIAFTPDEELGRIYWTGDLGRLNASGSIKMLGRKDFQVKIRGYRVETGEIETILLQHPAIKEVVTIAKADEAGDNYLSAYFVATEPLTAEALRAYLAAELPDYMVPRYFIELEKMPLTDTGKIDRKMLPEPGETAVSQSIYVAPTNEIEEKVAAIWQEVLGVEKVGIHDNFIQLGGHSLLVVSIRAKIHQVFNVELQLNDFFNYPTVKEQAQLIEVTHSSLFFHIEPSEEKEYYPLTADQSNMFVLNQFDGIGTTYNLPGVIPLDIKNNHSYIEQLFQKLIERHEAFRTSFKMINNRPVQIIHEHVEFQIPYITDMKAGEKFKKFIADFIRPFDLSKAPLIRACLVRLETELQLLLDIHHIIADGLSMEILIKEVNLLSEGKELPGLKVQYRDYAQWKNRFILSDRFKKQEEYWQDVLQGQLPLLNLPLNYPRPHVQNFAGETIYFPLPPQLTEQLGQLLQKTGTTLFMVMLSMYYILLHKYTGMEDIIVGSLVAGRNHSDLENIVGMFVNTLVFRNYPQNQKSYDSFLKEVKFSSLKTFENQDYPFSLLVEKFAVKHPSYNRNPLFDVAFSMQSRMAITDKSKPQDAPQKNPLGYETTTSKFDLTFGVFENTKGITCYFQYCSKLFKPETIELMKERFLMLAENILKNSQANIEDYNYEIPLEKELIKMKKVEFDF